MNKCAFEINGKCIALNVHKCAGCSFFKTKDQLEQEHEKSRQRLREIGRQDLIKFYKL